MDKRELIGELKRVNEYYGEKAEAAFERGDREEGLDYGHMADAHGEAAKALERGEDPEYVNNRWNGILDF